MSRKLNSNQISVIIFSLYAILTLVLWQFPFGKVILYPFTILGTWFHETAHGFAAMVLGGTFHQLEIFSNGSGWAMYSGDLFLGNIGKALVAAAGPIGPTVAGALFIISAKNPKYTQAALIILGLLLIVSAIIWIRSFFGLGIIIAFGVLTLWAAIKGTPNIKRNMILFLGVQSCLSVYLSIDYLLTKEAYVDGSIHSSDTGTMAEYLLLPHYVWGYLIIFFSVYTIIKSLSIIYKGK